MVVVVELVDVETELEVDDALVDEVEAEVEEVETVVTDVLVLELEVEEEVELVEVELVEVLEVLDEVEEVEVDEVEVDVVTLSRGNNSPTATLYTFPTTTAEALVRLGWLIARI